MTVSDDGTVKVWRIAARQELYDLYRHSIGLRAVRLSPDGRQLACVPTDSTCILLIDLGGANTASLQSPTVRLVP